jgi:hypothetical protein
MNQKQIQIIKTTITTSHTTISITDNKQSPESIVQQASFRSYQFNRDQGLTAEAMKSMGFPNADLYEEVYLMTIDN